MAKFLYIFKVHHIVIFDQAQYKLKRDETVCRILMRVLIIHIAQAQSIFPAKKGSEPSQEIGEGARDAPHFRHKT